MSHTPGTWTVSELDATGEISEHHIFIEPGVAVIERKVAGQNQCDMDDALLLAAAKELLEMLRVSVIVLEKVEPSGDPASDEVLTMTINTAKAVIAKATGAPATPAPEPVQVEQHCPGSLPKCNWVPMLPFGSKCTTCGDSIPF